MWIDSPAREDVTLDIVTITNESSNGPTDEQVRTAVAAYAAAVTSGDRARLLDLFAEDAVLYDPYPTGLFEGNTGIGAWWDTVVAPMLAVEIEVRELHVCGDRAAAVWTNTATVSDGVKARLGGVDVFTVRDDGRIVSMVAYWDASTAVMVP